MPEGEQEAVTQPALSRLIDTKSLLHLNPYNGDKSSFLAWKWSFLVAVRAIDPRLHEALKRVEDNVTQDFTMSRLSEAERKVAEQVYTVLALLCKEEASMYIQSAEDGNGLQAWQTLLRAKTVRNATTLLNQLLDPKFTTADPRINLRQWNKNANEYTARTGETVSDGLKKSVYLNKIAPTDMRQHLMLNQGRLDTAESIAHEIEDYCDALEEFSKDASNGQPGFVAPVGKGQEKGKGKGKAGEKGKGKLHKGLGFQPPRGEQRRFGGYCNWCWRIGHKEAQCWFKQEYLKSNPGADPGQRDIREWTHTGHEKGHSKGKGKGSGKGKGKAHNGWKGKGEGPGQAGGHAQEPPQQNQPNPEHHNDRQRSLGEYGFKRQRVDAVWDEGPYHAEYEYDIETPGASSGSYIRRRLSARGCDG